MKMKMRVLPIITLSGLLLGASAALAADRSTETLYKTKCAVCHLSGAAGAPKTGNAAQWAPRIAKGKEVMLNSVVKGLNAMPPKGLCMDCTDAEFTALIDYMIVAK